MTALAPLGSALLRTRTAMTARRRRMLGRSSRTCPRIALQLVRRRPTLLRLGMRVPIRPDGTAARRSSRARGVPLVPVQEARGARTTVAAVVDSRGSDACKPSFSLMRDSA